MQHVELNKNHCKTIVRLSCIGISARRIKEWSPFQRRTVIPAKTDGTEGQRESERRRNESRSHSQHQIKFKGKDSGGMKGRVKSYGLYGIPSR